MTGQELIDIIKTNNLESFQITVKFTEPTPTSEWGITYRSFDIGGLDDIGHSDKVAIIGIVERE